MAGYFELVDAPDGGYRIRMLDGAGSLMAISVTFPTKRAAVAGIAQAREIAGTGLIRDRSSGAARWSRRPGSPDGRWAVPAGVPRWPEGHLRPESGPGHIADMTDGGHSAKRADSPRRAAVLFDVDGTLVDSSYLHTLAWWQAFRQAGYDVPMASIHRSVGMGGDKILAKLLPAGRDTDSDQQLMASHAAVFATFWPALRPLDGARELLADCHGRGLAVALASSARERDLAVLRATIGADDFIDAATSSADAKESKPAPDILVAALDAVDVPARDAVYVGDAVWDIYAAGRLGIPAIGLTCGGTSAAELRDAGAVEIHDSPRALLANLADSAIGKLAARAPRR